MFPLSFEAVDDRKSSRPDGGTEVDSDLGPRRGGLVGDAVFDPASLGVNGLCEGRYVVLNVGVKGLLGGPLFCLSRVIVEVGGFLESAG